MKRTFALIITFLLLLSPTYSTVSDTTFIDKHTTCFPPAPSDISETVDKLNCIKNVVNSDSPNNYNFIMNSVVFSTKSNGDLLYYTKEQAAEFIEEIESTIVVKSLQKGGLVPDISYHEDNHQIQQSIFTGTAECFSNVYVSSYTQKSEHFDGLQVKGRKNICYSKDIKVNGREMTVCKLKNYFHTDYEVYYKTDECFIVFSFDATDNFRFKELKDTLEKTEFIKIGELMKDAEQTT